ncbi:LapA family protein [Erythrobacter rubeus]|uniref:Lipopolysaccharide assembly protein A domain-containing protein n=1 Tax=Erythrobacter rubeus TaxID=2760803 RepID=A0ABR8KM16_9SPHN|nr:hypothetical protein [Erythrobacter rubeus]MBD2841538.1 hypothetical protein [Erythrobacter rubeus]
MQIVRTIVWVLILFAILTFSFFNWESVEVTLWDNLVLETRIPALVIIAFVLGLAPMWLYHRSVKWSLDRRIRSLENSVKSNALSKRHEPAPTSPASAPAAAAVGNPGDKPVSAGDTLTPTGGDDGEK